MWVIKIGGSVTHFHNLKKWLELVAKHGDGQVIIVPGGGVFADAVRTFQTQINTETHLNLTDGTAHQLAIYAMDQMARSFVALQPELVLAKNALEIAERSWQHRGMVWLPSEMLLSDMTNASQDVAETWDVTSDTLAAWLAHHIEATHLLVIKSVEDLASAPHCQELTARGVLDASFCQYSQAASFNTWVLHHNAVGLFEQGFKNDVLPPALNFLSLKSRA